MLPFRSAPAGVVLALLLPPFLALAWGCDDPPPDATAPGPHVLDDRLSLTLFAQDPDIVTPIGLAIDAHDRLFVLESHTHTPPDDYDGPDGDRVKVLADTDGDGRADEVAVFAEGVEDGMNLAFSPSGELYVVGARAVWALHDRDGDGQSEARTAVLTLAEPDDVYDHAALLGIAFSPDGWMYVSRGNTGGQAWRLEGTDGSAVEGYGDGGNVVRARPDGSDVEEVATGFWNPFALAFDAQGRLLAADNDPDSRGPNRLVHVVPDGDYGYRSLYGGSGIHPYLAWNGELPGTLPYVAGLGEAPSGLLHAREAALPPDYAGSVLATIWEESRITRTRLTPHGASLTGATDVVIEGDADFRPVALAADSRGAVYVTDWVLRQYPNHGRGRVWRIASEASPAAPPAAERPAKNPLADLYGTTDLGRLRAALTSPDPFVRHAATVALARPALHDHLVPMTESADAEVRLGALLALERAGHGDGAAAARRLLADPDERVRRSALVWIGRAGMTALRPDLDRALDGGAISPGLFETYLATVRHLAPAFVEAYRGQAERYAKSLERPLPPQFVESLVADTDRPAAIRALALSHLERPREHVDLLLKLLGESEPPLRLEAVRTLAHVAAPEAADPLLAVAQDAANLPTLRAEALLALTRQPTDATPHVVPLLDDPNVDVQIEAARYLRARPVSDALRSELEERLSLGGMATPVREQVGLLLGTAADRPETPQAWAAALAEGGDPARGRRVFFSAQATCSTCHAVQGRGGDLGPDLSNAGRSKSHDQLARAILRPSAEVSPEWQGWFIRLNDGRTVVGRQIDVGGGSIELYTSDRGFVSFEKSDIATYGMAERSLMPDGLESRLTVSDLRDLVAFLEHGD